MECFQDHIVCYKSSLNKFRKTDITSSIFFYCNGIKPEINYRKKTGKNTNTFSQLIKMEIKQKIKTTLGQMKMKTQLYKIYGLW